jgi:tRNA A-37 threonylcarbamoyl transferase component Bud32
MGAIYLATDRETGAEVVVKALVSYFDAADEQAAAAARERLAHEAETLAQLVHPCVPRTFGLCEDGAQLFLVMEYLPGTDLDRRLTHTAGDGTPVAGQPFPLADVLRWGVALCRVLEYLAARPRPVIHHDIKPANVLVDPLADTVHLVDFGTARVRLSPGGTVGMDRSSLYGTVGYAPPEQYRGRSEPRSDVYALAATLYHLASDDDPADHPFSFPRLDALGRFGDALRPALEAEVTRRPFAAQLRQRLERLLDTAGSGLLRAPDGAWLADKAALVDWCVGEWQRATEWLPGRLPEQVARWWGDQQLAAGLRRIVAVETHPDRALDRALALIDPIGYGRERPQLACDTALVDFGRLPGSVLRRDVVIANTGRRYVDLDLIVPRWLNGTCEVSGLAPGGRTTLALAPEPGRMLFGGQRQGVATVRDRHAARLGRPLLALPVRASVPWRVILGRRGLPLGGFGLALLVWLGAGLPTPQPAPPALPAVLAAGNAPLAQTDVDDVLRIAQQHRDAGNYQAARTTLSAYLQQHGASAAVRAQLNDVLYAEAVLLLEQGNWQGARAALEVLLALSPNHGDAPELLGQTYQRAAQAALARGDREGARRELQALLKHQQQQLNGANTAPSRR